MSTPGSDLFSCAVLVITLCVVLSPSYEFIKFIQNNFNQPYALALDADQNLYVADASNNQIQIFDPEGNHKYSFGKQGSQRGTLSTLQHLWFFMVSVLVSVPVPARVPAPASTPNPPPPCP